MRKRSEKERERDLSSLVERADGPRPFRGNTRVVIYAAGQHLKILCLHSFGSFLL